MTKSAVALRQDWSPAAAEVNDNESVAIVELRELLKHLHFMLPPQRQIPALRRAFGTKPDYDETKETLRRVHLFTAFGHYLEFNEYREKHGRMIARIYACAEHVSQVVRKKQTMLCSLSDMQACERVIDACVKLKIKPFAFAQPGNLDVRPLLLRHDRNFAGMILANAD